MSSSIFAVTIHKIIELTLVCRIGEYSQRISHLEVARASIEKIQYKYLKNVLFIFYSLFCY